MSTVISSIPEAIDNGFRHNSEVSDSDMDYDEAEQGKAEAGEHKFRYG
jgi:hypothetical protein